MTDLRRLKAFVAVAQELHFGRAAQRLHLSQPPLTRLITSLEKDLGFILFERSTRSVDLTPEGREYLPYARQVLESSTSARDIADKIAAGKAGTLRIAFASSIALSDLFTRWINVFCENHPDVIVTLNEMASKAQWSRLSEGLIDVALVRSAPVDEADIDIQVVETESLVVAVPDHYPDSVQSLRELAKHPIIQFPGDFGSGLNEAVDTLFARHQLRLVPGPTAAGVAAIVALVAAGQGIAILPACARCIQRTGVRYLAIDCDDATIPHYVLTNTQRRSMTTSAFLAILKGM